MSWLLYHVGGPELVALQGGKKWTYVNDIKHATTFPSEVAAMRAREQVCNFPWITEILYASYLRANESRPSRHRETPTPYEF
jgi:hypothetical protein